MEVIYDLFDIKGIDYSDSALNVIVAVYSTKLCNVFAGQLQCPSHCSDAFQGRHREDPAVKEGRRPVRFRGGKQG
jgi:hypothetical protein